MGNNIIETSNAALTLDNIKHLIDSNPKMMHIDFTSCGLNEEEVYELGISIRLSGSMQAFHLCMNPGVNEKVI